MKRFGKPKDLMLSSCKFGNGSEIVIYGGFNVMKKKFHPLKYNIYRFIKYVPTTGLYVN